MTASPPSGETLPARPAHPAVRVGADGKHWIEAHRCNACGAVFDTAPLACRRCGRRDSLAPFASALTGTLWSWTVVHRSHPGIALPFVSAIVDLDDGLAIKGTLRDVDTATLRQGLPVRLVFDDAGGARDERGAAYVGFHFVPAGERQ